MEINNSEQAKLATLQISGVFARLKSGHINIDRANQMVSEICAKLDNFLDKCESDKKDSGRQMQTWNTRSTKNHKLFEN